MKDYNHTFNFPLPPNNRFISNNNPKAILKFNTQILDWINLYGLIIDFGLIFCFWSR